MGQVALYVYLHPSDSTALAKVQRCNGIYMDNCTDPSVMRSLGEVEETGVPPELALRVNRAAAARTVRVV